MIVLIAIYQNIFAPFIFFSSGRIYNFIYTYHLYWCKCWHHVCYFILKIHSTSVRLELYYKCNLMQDFLLLTSVTQPRYENLHAIKKKNNYVQLIIMSWYDWINSLDSCWYKFQILQKYCAIMHTPEINFSLVLLDGKNCVEK